MSAESIGERLKKIRQEKGLSLEEAHKKTKIHLNILKAIEGDSLTNLSPVYLKGFLKIYCNFLGLDPKECLLDHKEPKASPENAQAAREKHAPLKVPPFLGSAGIKLNSLRSNKKFIKLIVWIIIVYVSGSILLKITRFISSRPKVSPAVRQMREERAPAKAKAIAQPASATRPKVSEVKLPRETTGGISLVIAAKENCLVFVKVDGRVVLHRVLERGRSDSWKAKDKIELSLGNAAAVELIVNGQRFANLGRRGQQLKNITITEKDGLRIPR